MSKHDNLTEDTQFLPANQKFVCISFLTPTKEDGTTLSGLKIRGVFAAYEDACQHAKKIQSYDPEHNVFVGDMGKWLAFDPDSESEYVKDAEYANEKLNSIMKNYKENQEKSKLFHERQKNIQIQNNLTTNIEQKKKNKQELLDGDESIKQNITSSVEEIDKQIKKMEERQRELSDINKGLSLKLDKQSNINV